MKCQGYATRGSYQLHHGWSNGKATDTVIARPILPVTILDQTDSGLREGAEGERHSRLLERRQGKQQQGILGRNEILITRRHCIFATSGPLNEDYVSTWAFTTTLCHLQQPLSDLSVCGM